jgi:hypothetical protein
MIQFGGFDATFDFRTEAGSGDPDERSPTLRAYHKLLWSKPLPSGDMFELNVINTYRPFLHHLSSRGEFYLTSDSAIPTWIDWERTAELIQFIPVSDLVQFRTIANQIGGKLLFPGKQRNRRPTINQERAGNKIVDRLDLTLECIRLHYLKEDNPLAEALARYEDFFDLFDNFKGYTDFFLLQDLVSEESSTVRFFMPFADFRTPPLPQTVEAYQDYRQNAIRFVEARNRRMSEYVTRV